LEKITPGKAASKCRDAGSQAFWLIRCIPTVYMSRSVA
jgi:hypothetical protein